MTLETRAGVRRLILNDLAPEVSPHSKEVLQEVSNTQNTQVALTQQIRSFDPKAGGAIESNNRETLYKWNGSGTSFAPLFSFSVGSRCRDGERSGENEVFSGRESDPSSPGASPIPPSSGSSKEPLKVMPAPPPKENVWAKRSAASTGSYDGEGRPPLSPVSPSSSTPPKSRWEHGIHGLETP